jgi:phage terminase small subunit
MTTDVIKSTRPAWAADLSDREQAFVEAYVATLSATEAAERAGMGNTRKSCRESGHRMLHRPRVSEAIATLIEQRTDATKSRVIEEVSRLAFSSIADVLTVRDGALVVHDHADLDRDTLATIASIEENMNERGYKTLKVRQHDRLAALQLLALGHEHQQGRAVRTRRPADAGRPPCRHRRRQAELAGKATAGAVRVTHDRCDAARGSVAQRRSGGAHAFY